MGAGDDLTIAALIEALDERGIELWFEGARLRFRAPKGALTARTARRTAARREEIVAHLRAAPWQANGSRRCRSASGRSGSRISRRPRAPQIT